MENVAGLLLVIVVFIMGYVLDITATIMTNNKNKGGTSHEDSGQSL